MEGWYLSAVLCLCLLWSQVCTKVASFLEQGQRLENLSWRLWHLQNLIVETDNAKSKREFKKLSKHMGDKLDKEKGR
jgi:GATA-binding protein